MTGSAGSARGTLVVLFTSRAMRELLAAVTSWRENRLDTLPVPVPRHSTSWLWRKRCRTAGTM